MKILTTAIVSSSDMVKNYKACRDKAESFDKIFILKNNQPDAVLFSISEYERLSAFIEYLESHEEEDISKIMDSLPKKGNRQNYSIDQLRYDIGRKSADLNLEESNMEDQNLALYLTN